MKSKADIITCLEDERKWADKADREEPRFDTLSKFIHQGWSEALTWVLDEREPTTADEYNDHIEVLGKEEVVHWTCNVCNDTFATVVDGVFNDREICPSCTDTNFVPIAKRKE